MRTSLVVLQSTHMQCLCCKTWFEFVNKTAEPIKIIPFKMFILNSYNDSAIDKMIQNDCKLCNFNRKHASPCLLHSAKRIPNSTAINAMSALKCIDWIFSILISNTWKAAVVVVNCWKSIYLVNKIMFAACRPVYLSAPLDFFFKPNTSPCIVNDTGCAVVSCSITNNHYKLRCCKGIFWQSTKTDTNFLSRHTQSQILPESLVHDCMLN